MGDMEDNGLIGIGVKASLANLYKKDQARFVEELADSLERALPEETVVERKGGIFGAKRIAAVRILLGDYLYSLETPARGALSASTTKIVRGIKLKTEPMSIDAWLSAVSGALSEFAEANQQARDALWALVERTQEDAQ